MKKKTREKTALVARPADELSNHQRTVLNSLAALSGWARPMDIGARDGSHHSATLSGLARRGLVERKKLHAIYCYNGLTYRQKLVGNRWIVTEGHPPHEGCCCKGSCRYRITTAGRRALK